MRHGDGRTRNRCAVKIGLTMPDAQVATHHPEDRGGMFRSLRNYNFRVWFLGGLVSNIGTWMQRIAQDWLVLTSLSRHSAGALGVVVALQFAPQLLFLPWTGYAADRLDLRRLLMATQAALGLLALGLGLVTVLGVVRLWQVDAFAFLLGCVTAFDAPARQVFVNELVGPSQLVNAVALNSTSFNAARMVGPAVAGLLIAAIGSGGVFLLNAASFVAVLGSLRLLRVDELHTERRLAGTVGGVAEGFRYVWRRADLMTVLVMLFLIGAVGLNFAIYISTMALTAFHGDAGLYGVLTSAFAIGSVSGALYAAHRDQPGMGLLGVSAATFGVGCALAALSPDVALFAAALVLTGFSALIFITTTNSFMQLTSAPAMRGRVMALRIAVAMGGTPLGALIVGWVADRAGPRWALGVGAASGIAAALVAVRHLRSRGRAPAGTDA
jgi:MFS family permease